MPDARLAAVFKGINRRLAPHLLSEGESPDCLDCGPGGELAGILGPRKGRRKVFNQSLGNIRGVGIYRMPGEKFRIFCTSDGTLHPEVLTLPDTANTPPLGGDSLYISALTVTRTGAGTTNGTAKTLDTSIDLSQFVNMSMDLIDYSNGMSSTETGGFTTGNVTLQALIGAVWTDVWRWSYGAAGTIEAQLLTLPTTGILSQVRLQATSDVSGNLKGDFAGKFKFHRQADAATIGVS